MLFLNVLTPKKLKDLIKTALKIWNSPQGLSSLLFSQPILFYAVSNSANSKVWKFTNS